MYVGLHIAVLIHTTKKLMDKEQFPMNWVQGKSTLSTRYKHCTNFLSSVAFRKTWADHPRLGSKATRMTSLSSHTTVGWLWPSSSITERVWRFVLLELSHELRRALVLTENQKKIFATYPISKVHHRLTTNVRTHEIMTALVDQAQAVHRVQI